MKYTERQIKLAKQEYDKFLRYRTVDSFDPEFVGMVTAEQRCQFHNDIVRSILNGNKQLERNWKLFFLNTIVRGDQKLAESKAKKTANKEASASLLKQIKDSGKKLGDYYKWLDDSSNPYRREYYSKKFSQNSVNQFLSN